MFKGKTLIEKYLEKLKEKNYAVSSIKKIRYVLKPFVVEGVSKESIGEYQRKIAGLDQNTRNSYLSCLARYLKKYHEKLVEEVNIPKKLKKLPKEIPSQEEVKTILQRPDVLSFKGIRDRLILEFFYGSGIRLSELRNLRLEDVDYKKQLILINQGKNKKDRICPISSVAMRLLKKYLEKVREKLKGKENYIFLGPRGRKMNAKVPWRIVKKYGEYSPHKYRHAYATHLLQNGMKETSLQRLLGHSRLSTTQVYTKVTIADLKESYRRYHLRDKWD